LIVALDRLALDRFSSTFCADLGTGGSGYRKRLRVILLMGYHRTHRVLFAMQIKDKYKFSSENADPFQTVKGWLLSYRSLTRGLE
jgi:hypothetical protein